MIIFIPKQFEKRFIEIMEEFEQFEVDLPKEPTEDRRYKKQQISEDMRWEVFERDNFTCKKCGSRRFLQADHIIAERNGGVTMLENLQTLCKTCNQIKGSK